MPKILITLVSVLGLALVPMSTLAQQVLRPAILTSTPVAVADLPVQSQHTGSLVLLPGPEIGIAGATSTSAATALFTRLQSENVPFLSGDYADLQRILQQRDLLFWQLPVWTVIINLLSALVLLMVARKEPHLPLLRWLFGFALAGNLYFLPGALAMPVMIQLGVNAVYLVAILLFMHRLRRPVSVTSQANSGFAHTVFQITLLVLMILAGIDTLVLVAGYEFASHPGMTLQLVPIGQIAGVLAALYFLTGRHAEMRAELQSLNSSLDQRVAQATAELQIRYRDLTREALDAARMNERRTIYQSIHEDLGDKLLQLIYATRDDETMDLARSALAELRDSRSLSTDQPRVLGEVLADIRSEAQIRCDHAGVTLCWQQDDRLPDVGLNARQFSALSRTVREAFSNLLKHARASVVTVNVSCGPDHRLRYRISDNGKGMEAGPTSGRGLLNMRSRVTELGGSLARTVTPGGGVTLEFMMPMLSGQTKGNGSGSQVTGHSA